MLPGQEIHLDAQIPAPEATPPVTAETKSAEAVGRCVLCFRSFSGSLSFKSPRRQVISAIFVESTMAPGP